jgi:hypothetical protein
MPQMEDRLIRNVPSRHHTDQQSKNTAGLALAFSPTSVIGGFALTAPAEGRQECRIPGAVICGIFPLVAFS